ncbi:hypothetical protein PSAB6_50196 [Paraburkholderia sabiae]|nr:hypothetical protein PSAB6_50196 [Paraburkholderia sabiae]
MKTRAHGMTVVSAAVHNRRAEGTSDDMYVSRSKPFVLLYMFLLVIGFTVVHLGKLSVRSPDKTLAHSVTRACGASPARHAIYIWPRDFTKSERSEGCPKEPRFVRAPNAYRTISYAS